MIVFAFVNDGDSFVVVYEVEGGELSCTKEAFIVVDMVPILSLNPNQGYYQVNERIIKHFNEIIKNKDK